MIGVLKGQPFHKISSRVAAAVMVVSALSAPASLRI